MNEQTVRQTGRRIPSDPSRPMNPSSPKEQRDNGRRLGWWRVALVVGLAIGGWVWQSAVRERSGSANQAAITGGRATSPETATLDRPSLPSFPSKGLDNGALPSEETRAESAGEATDEVYRKKLVGNWQTYRSGKRSLTVRDDGTATMVVQPEGAWTYLFGSRLTFEIEWTIEDGELIYSATGGKPEAKIKLVTEMWGTQRRQSIREITEDRLVLVDEDGGEDHVWKQVESPEKDRG